jgi:hypothetical protein
VLLIGENPGYPGLPDFVLGMTFIQDYCIVLDLDNNRVSAVNINANFLCF